MSTIKHNLNDNMYRDPFLVILQTMCCHIRHTVCHVANSGSRHRSRGQVFIGHKYVEGTHLVEQRVEIYLSVPCFDIHVYPILNSNT